MIHPSTELKTINKTIGYGVVAAEFIPEGTIIWTLCDFDRIFTPLELSQLPPHYREIIDKYSYVNSSGETILCWDYGRYMNHSCSANTFTLDEFNYIAIRNIHEGEEITCDYAQLNYSVEELNCSCGQPTCRKIIRNKDVFLYADIWDNAVYKAFANFSHVKQPLLPFVKNKKYLSALQNGVEKIPTTKITYIDRKGLFA
ncbi:MAG: SET domain-containing protein [Desulfamplus sp.]|nr:SET domain-containing protein [Desulfamplus sp.]